MAKRKATTVEQLSPEALRAFRRAGFKVTEHGNLDTGVTDGPCAKCGELHRLYGPGGNPLCRGCRGGGRG